MIKNFSRLFFHTLVFMMTILSFSCSDHVEDIDHYTYSDVKPGNVLLLNNKIVRLEKLTTSSEKKDVIGVVMHVAHDSAWVVSTKELGRKAYLDTLMSVSNVSTDINALCGKENTAALLVSGQKSPAAEAAYHFSSPIYGWSLPSIGELRILSSNLDVVTKTMDAIGGDPFKKDQYVSSSEDGSSEDTKKIAAYCITLQTGYISSIGKLDKGYVRAVLRMKIR